MPAAARSLGLGLMLLALTFSVSAATAPATVKKDAGSDPRRHHYFFAHRFLRQIFFEHYEQFYPRLAQDPAGELTALWQHVANGMSERERLPSDGLGEVARLKQNGREIVILALPEAQAMAEAVFVVLISGENERTYLTYERTISFADNEPLAVLCGWTPEGKHVNFGLRASPDRKGLDQVLAKLLEKKPANVPAVPRPQKGN